MRARLRGLRAERARPRGLRAERAGRGRVDGQVAECQFSPNLASPRPDRPHRKPPLRGGAAPRRGGSLQAGPLRGHVAVGLVKSSHLDEAGTTLAGRLRLTDTRHTTSHHRKPPAQTPKVSAPTAFSPQEGVPHSFGSSLCFVCNKTPSTCKSSAV